MIEPKKLKVTELRDELKSRGLDTKGTKPVLVKRLEKALKAEAGETADESLNESQDTSVLETTTEELDESTSQSHEDSVQETSQEDTKTAVQEPEITQEPTVVKEPSAAEELAPVEPEAVQDSSTVEEQITDESPVAPELVAPEPVAPEPEAKVTERLVDEKEVHGAENEESEIKMEETEVKAEEPDIQLKTKEEPMETVTNEEDVVQPPAEYKVMDSIGETDLPDTEQKVDDHEHKESRKRRRSRSHSLDRRRSRHGRSRSPRRRHSRSRSPDRRRRSGSKDRHRRSRDRSHDRSRHRDRSRSPRPKQERTQLEDKEEWVTSTNVQWDKFNCDLNIRINEDGYKCNPVTVEGFAFMWAGARTNYGFTKGKLGFECKILELLNVNHLPEEETSRHVVRVGFSTDDNSMQLGEEKLSYGYGGTAKASTDCKFKDFGHTFGQGDVIGAYVDFEGDKVQISYTKNGEDLGVCFEIDKTELGENALFPHVLTKNCEFTANFGQKETPFFPLKEGFSWVSSSPLEERVRGQLPPVKKEDCEVIMMVGLPGAGKTYWVNKYVQEHKDKRYQVLGTNNIIDKMKVMGLPRKRNYAGRWDSLIDKSTKCLNRLLEIASKKKRNYIVDQTNVYHTARRRKMRSFEGFHRTAIVIVPEDEEFKKRCEKREKEEGKEIPDSAVWEMKANFVLPDEGSVFDNVEFIELNQEKARELVSKYNKEGEANLPPDYRQNRFNRDHRGGYGNYGGNRYGGDRRDYHDRDGGYRGGGGGGRYDNRDRDRNNRGGSWRGNRGYYSSRSNYMGYSSQDNSRASKYDSNDRDSYKKDYRSGGSSNSGSSSYNSGSNYNSSGDQNSGYNSSSGGWNNQQSWGNQGGWGGQQQGSWGNQQQQGWGSWGQWGYSQQPQSGQQAAPQQAWGQGYNYYQYPQQSGWGNYNYNYQQPSQQK